MPRYERKDALYRRAKASGLRSRAAFKLEDLAGDLLRRGARVVDLGCWPGGWSQVAARRVGPTGLVVGVDVRSPGVPPAAHVRFLEGDVSEPSVIERIAELLGAPADTVLSDMAPGLTGIRDRDEARTAEVGRTALEAACRLLRPGGSFLCKTFVNGEFEAFGSEVRRSFGSLRSTRPPSTRKGSSEIYVVARDFRPTA